MSEFDDIISYLNKIVKIIKYNSMLVKKINTLNGRLIIIIQPGSI
jgi:hypothetical protein